MKHLKEYMYENDLTVRELAKLLCIHYSYLSRILSGSLQPGDRLKFKIDRLLNGK